MAPQTTHHIPFVNEIVSYKAKDRLKELKAANQDLNGNSVIAQENATITAEGRIMIKFFAEVERILETIFKIRDSVREVEKMHREILLDPKDDQNKKLILEELMANFQETAKNVRAELKALKQKEKQQTKKSPTYLRIQQTQFSTLSWHIYEIITNYNLSLASYREICKHQIQEQFEIYKMTKTEEEIEEIIQIRANEASPNRITEESIIKETQMFLKMEINGSLAETETLQDDIIKLENSIKELHEMFLSFSLSMEKQGELIHSIESHVKNAREHVEEGAQDIELAHQYQMQYRLMKWSAIITIVYWVVRKFVL